MVTVHGRPDVSFTWKADWNLYLRKKIKNSCGGEW
jgi:hypothetical protein